MRTATQVLAGYVMLLLVACVWRLMPFERAAPDIVSLLAVYLGLTSRRQVAPATAGAVAIGYLGDLMFGTPRGLNAAVAGVVCVLGHLVHRRLLVRGRSSVFAFSLATGTVGMLLAMGMSMALAPAGRIQAGQWSAALISIVLTAITGPVIFRICRSVDARFARTQRDRSRALEGLVS